MPDDVPEFDDVLGAFFTERLFFAGCLTAIGCELTLEIFFLVWVESFIQLGKIQPDAIDRRFSVRERSWKPGYGVYGKCEKACRHCCELVQVEKVGSSRVSGTVDCDSRLSLRDIRSEIEKCTEGDMKSRR